MSAFRVKLGANDLNCVDVPLNHTHSLTYSLEIDERENLKYCDLAQCNLVDVLYRPIFRTGPVSQMLRSTED